MLMAAACGTAGIDCQYFFWRDDPRRAADEYFRPWLSPLA